MSKVYDCCIINNELDMLELRLNILRDVVDYHVIVEAEQTHSGLSKRASIGMALATPRFAEFRDKLIYICLPDLAGDHSWAREYNHRASIAPLLERFGKPAPDDWVIVADVDEIPHPAAVAAVLQREPEQACAQLDLTLFYYDFSHRVKQGWAVGMCQWKAQQDANKIRRLEFNAQPMASRALGWHLSYFMNPTQIIDKLNSFMHSSDVAADVPRDADWIAERMAAGQDLFGRTVQITRVDPETLLPQYVRDNRAKYVELGWLETEKVAT